MRDRRDRVRADARLGLLSFVFVLAFIGILGTFADFLPRDRGIWPYTAVTLFAVIGILVLISLLSEAFDRRSQQAEEATSDTGRPGTLFILHQVSQFTFGFAHELEAWTNGWKVTAQDNGTLKVRFADGHLRKLDVAGNDTLVCVGNDVYFKPPAQPPAEDASSDPLRSPSV